MRRLLGLSLVLLCGCTNLSSLVPPAPSASIVEADPAKVNPALEGKHVHLVGLATAQVELEDPVFNVHATTLRLSRVVEMLQWQQTVIVMPTSGKNRAPAPHPLQSYSKVWASHPIDSNQFRERQFQNPPFPFLSQKFAPASIQMESFTLPSSVFSELPASRGVDLPADLKLPATPQLHKLEQRLYSGDPSKAKIGDLRVYWEQLDPGPFSLIGAQNGASIGRFPSQNGSMMVMGGSHTAAEMMGER